MKRFFQRLRLLFSNKDIVLKDRLKNVEIEKKYGTKNWAQRHPKTRYDLEANKVNANVYIATRAISDAIKSLKINIVETETIKGVEREVDNNDHEANEILLQPNTEHSFSDIIDYMVKSYLTDGNSILTIEKLTGPNRRIEIWPRDPRNVEINTNDRSYKFGSYSRQEKVYKRNQVVHIRDMDVDDPFWGIGRINTVREEIEMDYHINRFNNKFFENGATLNLMFTPEENLTEDQHEQLLDAMRADIAGVENAFQIFINRYAGKYEYPDQKHKEIAFLELLKHNREKIFGVFGLPPFRGGIMEYGNYANTLMQDKDYWRNTIGPILKVFEDGLNTQLIWPLYGTNIKIKFDLDSVPAIKGDDSEITDRLIKLKKAGIVSGEYVRKELNIDEDAAPNENPQDNPDIKDGKEEKEKVENALFSLYRNVRTGALLELLNLTSDGDFMSVLCDPISQSEKIYPKYEQNNLMLKILQPVIQESICNYGLKRSDGIFKLSKEQKTTLEMMLSFKIEDIVQQNSIMIQQVIEDVSKFNLTYNQLKKRILQIFSYERCEEISVSLIDHFLLSVTIANQPEIINN